MVRAPFFKNIRSIILRKKILSEGLIIIFHSLIRNTCYFTRVFFLYFHFISNEFRRNIFLRFCVINSLFCLYFFSLGLFVFGLLIFCFFSLLNFTGIFYISRYIVLNNFFDLFLFQCGYVSFRYIVMRAARPTLAWPTLVYKRTIGLVCSP